MIEILARQQKIENEEKSQILNHFSVMFFDEFTKSQLTSWPLARNNYERLRNVIYRTIDFEEMCIRDRFSFKSLETIFTHV